MATFKVKNPVNKEWSDKRFVETYLVPIDENGNEIGKETKVSFWNGEVSMEGGLFKPTIVGELGTNAKGYPVLNTPKQAAGNNFKTIQAEKLMDKKEHSIERFQDSKEFAIRTASTMSGAVALAVAQFTDKNDLRTLEELVEHYRRFLWNHWSDTDKFPPFQ